MAITTTYHEFTCDCGNVGDDVAIVSGDHYDTDVEWSGESHDGHNWEIGDPI